MATAKEERAKADRGEGCLGKAANDEPVFVLRAQDRCFIPTLNAWIAEAARLGAPNEKIREAYDLLIAAAAWQRDHQDRIKTPD